MRFPLRLLFFLVFLIIEQAGVSQEIFFTDSKSEHTIRFIGGWKFHCGDDAGYASASFNDSLWKVTKTSFSDPQEQEELKGICWFRLHLKIDSSLNNEPLSFIINQTGASEIYFDGKLIGGFGKVSQNADAEVRENPMGFPVPFNNDGRPEHVIAIRYSNHNPGHSFDYQGNPAAGFTLIIVPSSMYAQKLFTEKTIIGVSTALACFYLVLALLHFLIWIFYRSKKGNLYYVLFVLNLAIFPICALISDTTGNFTLLAAAKLTILFFTPVVFVSLLNLVYHFFYDVRPKRFKWFLAAGTIIPVMDVFSIPSFDILEVAFCFGATIDAIITTIIAVRRKKKGSRIIATGILLFTGFTFIALFSVIIAGFMGGNINLGTSGWGIIILVLFFLSVISIPVSMSVYLAKDFAETNISLQLKLEEVESLSRKNLEQEKEKQKILEDQKELLEQQVKERTAEIMQQKEVIEEKNKSITDSIQYAKRIQDAQLPKESMIQRTIRRLME